VRVDRLDYEKVTITIEADKRNNIQDCLRNISMPKENRIENFPISFFSVILGLAGLTIAFQKAEHVLNLPVSLSSYLLFFTGFSFLFITTLYLTKVRKYLSKVKKEFNHPVKVVFFSTFSISLLLLSIASLDFNVLLSKYLWISGSLLHLAFAVITMSVWIQHTKFNIEHINAAWFIPIVGNILVPIAGTAHFPHEISWFFFSIGLVFWLVFLVIFFYRIIFHHPMAERLLPTFFILIAPPAVGFIAYVKLTGNIDIFSRILYYFAMYLVILLIAQAKMFW